MKNMFSITGCCEQGEGVECAFGILTAKWQLLNKGIDMNVNKAERIVRCISLLHNISMGLKGTTQDPTVLQESLQFLGSFHATTDVSS